MTILIRSRGALIHPPGDSLLSRERTFAHAHHYFMVYMGIPSMIWSGGLLFHRDTGAGIPDVGVCAEGCRASLQVAQRHGGERLAAGRSRGHTPAVLAARHGQGPPASSADRGGQEQFTGSIWPEAR
jgi:hypothetical protein